MKTKVKNKSSSGYAHGGIVKIPSMMIKPMSKPSSPASPLTMARRNNGVPGMKGGGRVKR